MIQILLVGVAAYLAAGLYMTGPGPIGDELRKQHKADQLDIDSTVPRWKWVAYAVILNLFGVLAWPAYFVRFGNDPTSTPPSSPTKFEREPGLYFVYMGGAGTLSCVTCEYEQKLTSFIHGHTEGPDRWCRAAHQCRSCRKFTAVERHGDQKEGAPKCDCGGELTRDDVLVCPECGSKALRYRCEMIT